MDTSFNKNINHSCEGKIDIDRLADKILSQHSFCFSTFEAAKTLIVFQDIEYCFDRLSLCTYSHNMEATDFFRLGKALSNFYEQRFGRESQKQREEYCTLFHTMVLNNVFTGAKITKETQPDFVLDYHGKKIGVEVTELTTPQDKILAAISRQNFGTGKSADEVKADAIKKHGLKAYQYEYSQLDKMLAVGRPFFNVAEQHSQYAAEIIKKFKIYSDSFSQYSKFVILCNGCHSMCLSSKYDSEVILLLAKQKNPQLRGFMLIITRQDDSGKCVVDSFEV